MKPEEELSSLVQLAVASLWAEACFISAPQSQRDFNPDVQIANTCIPHAEESHIILKCYSLHGLQTASCRKSEKQV